MRVPTERRPSLATPSCLARRVRCNMLVPCRHRDADNTHEPLIVTVAPPALFVLYQVAGSVLLDRASGEV